MIKSLQGKETRRLILETAFSVIHRNGFRATSLSDILDRTKLTKGAFYYHFKSKRALGYAVIDELLKNIVYGTWLKPLETCEDPIECLMDQLTTIKLDKDVIIEGCPLNNLVVEMAPIDEGFRQRLNLIYDMWITVLAGSLSRGIKKGIVRTGIDTSMTAAFIVASMAGCRSIAKNKQSVEMLKMCHQSLILYLETLR